MLARQASILIVLILAAPAPVSAEDGMIEIGVGSARVGAEMGWGRCPCLRWTVEAEALNGRYETRDFLISVEALFQMRERRTVDFLKDPVSRLYTFGALEALWKGGIGIKFDGVTIGDDLDKSYTDVFATGLHVLFNIFHTESARLDLRSGAELERFRVNAAPQSEFVRMPQSLYFEWDKGAWSGDLRATVAFDASDMFNHRRFRYSGGGRLQARFLSLGQLEMALGMELGADHDPVRELFGLDPTQFTGGLYMELQWVAARETVEAGR